MYWPDSLFLFSISSISWLFPIRRSASLLPWNSVQQALAGRHRFGNLVSVVSIVCQADAGSIQESPMSPRRLKICTSVMRSSIWSSGMTFGRCRAITVTDESDIGCFALRNSRFRSTFDLKGRPQVWCRTVETGIIQKQYRQLLVKIHV